MYSSVNNFISGFLPSLILFWVHIGLNWADDDDDDIGIASRRVMDILYNNIMFIFIYHLSFIIYHLLQVHTHCIFLGSRPAL